jgi:hypothetical protein
MATAQSETTLGEEMSWTTFKARIQNFHNWPSSFRANVWFRGQANPAWRLQPSIDRLFAFESREDRTDRLAELLRAFWKHANGLHRHRLKSSTSATAEMIARHHGLPTSLLDWSASPYVAAFFALQEAPLHGCNAVSVWIMRRTLLDDKALQQIELIEPDETAPTNRRAVEQKSMFLRLNSEARFVDAIVPREALQRFDIYINDRKLALTELDSMNITARSMFRSMDGAARTALLRVQDYELVNNE